MEDFEILQGKIADLTKTADKPGGISLFKDKAKTEYKSTYEILKEISAIYHDLTDKNQAQLLEALAGKRGGQVLAGILNDFGEVEKAMTNMAGAAGSADDEMQIIRESISYQLNALRQTWVGFAQDLLDRGVLQKFVENLTILSEKFIKLTESNPVVVLSGIGAALLSIRSAFNGTFLKNIKEFIEFFSMAKEGKIFNYIKELNDITPENSVVTQLDDIAKLLSQLGGETVSQVEEVSEVIPDVVDGMTEGTDAALSMSDAVEKVGEITGTDVPSALGKFKTAIVSALTNPLFWAVAAIGSFVVAVNATIKANEELRKSAEQLGKDYSSVNKDLQSYKDEIVSIREKLNDSNISYEEAVSARTKLSEIQNELIEKYGEERAAIIDITDAIDGNVSALDRLSEKKWIAVRDQFNDQNLKGWDWMNQKIHGANDNVGVMLSEMENVSKSIRGVQSDYKAFEQAAKQFGGTVDVGDSIGEISLDLAADNADDLYEKLIKIREILEDNNASNKTLQSLNKQISNLKNTIDDYSNFYNQWVLNERILGDSTGQSYEDQWQEWQDAYNEYNQYVIDGNETLAKESKNNLLTQFNELRTELQERVANENDELTEGMATSILDAFRNTLPELQTDFAQADLRAALFIEPQVDETKINEVEDTLTEEPIELPATVVEGIDQIEKPTKSIVVGWDKTKESVDSIVPSLESVRNKTEEVEEEVLGVQRESEETLSDNQIAIQEATKRCEEYVNGLDDIYKSYNGINNIDRDIILWDDDTLAANKQFIEEMYDSFEEGAEDLKGTWSTVLGSSENFDGIEIAYTQMLQTDHGLVPLTENEFWNYFDSIFEQSWDGNVFDAEKFIQLDAQGTDAVINGQMEHVANMIAAAEGQVLNGIKLTADDVIAIGVPGFDEEGNDLLPGNESIFKGYSMHDVQAYALEYKKVIAEIGEEAESTGEKIDEALEPEKIEKPKIETPKTRLSEEGQRMVDATKAFTDAEELLSLANKNNFNNANEEQQKAYEILQNEADYFGVSIQQILDMLYEAKALDFGFMRGRSDKLANAYGKSRGIDISSDSRKQDYDVITAASDALSDEDYKTALQFTDNTWKQVEETAKNLIRDTDTNEQKAQKYKQVIEEVAGEWRKAKEEAQSVGPSSMSISQTVDSINEKIKPALDSIGDVYSQVLSAPNQLISGSLGKIDLIEQVEKIKSEFDSLNELEGIEVDYAPFEHLVEVLQDTSSTGKEVQDAFNGVATSVTNVGIQGTESIKTLVEALSDFGVTNSAEVVVSQMMDNTEALAEAGLDLQQISADLDVTNEEQLQSTYALIDAWGAEVLGASNTAEAMALLKMQVLLLNQNPLDESTSITELIRLAGVAGVATSSLQQLAEIQAKIAALSIELDNAIENNNSGAAAHVIQEIAMLQAKAEQVKTQVTTDVQDAITASYTSPQTTSSAGGAGSDAGKAYVDGFNEELSKLKESYERGEMSLSEYLNAYKALIEKYFSDTEKYAEERAKALHDYMQELKGYYDSAISGVITVLDKRISAAQKSKDKAIKAIEEERDAQVKALEEQKKAIEGVIKEKQKEIKELEKAKKPIQDEIDAIQKANEERQRQIDLQKDLYALEKTQMQRVQFIYKNGQMVYQQDTDSIRDAKQAVDEDKDEIRIAALQKQLDLIDDQIDAINEEIEALEEESSLIDEQIESLNEFYDKLIKEQEEYWDSIIEGLEAQKSKWEELAEIQTIGQAFKDMGGVFESLGISIEDVLNDAPGAFDKFKQAYLDVYLSSENYSDHIKAGVQEWSNLTGQSIGDISTKYNQAASEIGQATNQIDSNLEKTADSASKVADSTDKIANSSGGVSTYANEMDKAADSTGKVKTATEGLDEDINGVTQAVSEIGNSGEGIDNLVTQLEELRAKLTEIKLAVGTVATGSNGEQSLGGLGSLAGALQSLDSITLDNIIAQFGSLEGAISAVSSALGGGGGESSSTSGGFVGNTNAQATAMSNNGSGGNGSGLTGAIEAVKEATDTYIGTGGEEGGEGQEGGGTAISDFEALGTAVGNVTAAIGGGGGEGLNGGQGGTGLQSKGNMGQKGGSSEGGGDLISAVKDFGETNSSVLTGGEGAEGGAIQEWTDLNEQLGIADGFITNMAESLNSLEEMYKTTLQVTLEVMNAKYTGTATIGGGRTRYTLNIFEAMGLPGESWSSEDMIIPKGGVRGKAKLTGTANMSGNWGYEGGRTMIAEIGPELVVYPNGTFETFDHPQLVDLPRGSVIFNHIQTDEILDPNNQIKRKGKANLNGTLPNGLTPLSLADPEQFAQFMQLADALKANTEDMRVDLSDLSTMARDIERSITNTTYNNSNRNANITFGDLNFTCTGITSADVLSEVGDALQREFSGIALNAYQRAMAH